MLALVIAYPLAYVIAFRGGRFKTVLLGLVVVPFFTNFLIRTLAWKTILGDQGTVVDILRWFGILGASDGLLRTPLAVVGGLTYNFLPFMVLPIYVALEKIDPRLVDAARDLYSNTWRAFRKVIFPLSLPGVFAGSLLVFIPAAGDFVNSYYLGNAKTTMIGNVVQDQFLVQVNYPAAAALSFVFMAIVMVLVVDLRPRPRHGGPGVSDARSSDRSRAATVGRSRRRRRPRSVGPAGEHVAGAGFSAARTCSCRSS